jgi:membrane protein
MRAPALGPVASQVRRRTTGHDLPLAAAGLTFYALVAAIPLGLLVTRLVAVAAGSSWTSHRLLDAADLLPAPGRGAVAFFAQHGTSLPWGAALASLLPIGLYGEGLVRSFSRLSPETVRRRPLRGRVTAGALVLASPPALAGALVAVQLIGRPGLLLGTYLAFLVAWSLLSVLLALAYRLLTPAAPGPAALWWPAAAAGSVLAGFGLGFVWLLHLHPDVGQVYGGSTDLALAALAALWAYGLNLAALAGFAVAVGWEQATAGA